MNEITYIIREADIKRRDNILYVWRGSSVVERIVYVVVGVVIGIGIGMIL